MRISDWSSDVCSSDLQDGARIDLRGDVEADPRRQIRLDHAGDDVDRGALRRHDQVHARRARLLGEPLDQEFDLIARGQDRKSVVWGKSVSVRVDLGGGRLMKKKKKKKIKDHKT